MAGKKIDKKGNIFGRWTVLERSERFNEKGVYWLCKCKCGNENEVHNSALILGRSLSCGCSRLKENRRNKFFESRYKINSFGCWEWQGARDKNGYGLYGVKTKAHRYSYEKHKGKIPEGMCVCHNCPGGDNKGCVNPDHLWLGSQAENIWDKEPKGKQTKGQDSGRAKLTDKNVRSIRKKLEKGISGLVLAQEYKVTPGLIYHIKHRRTWKHLE